MHNQARSASTDIRVTRSCVSTHLGESQRVSITESAVALRDRWLCHPYVHPDTRELAEEAIRDIHTTRRAGADKFFPDRIRSQQEDPPHDAIRTQGFPRQQRPRCRPPPDAQQDLRRRDLPRRLLEEESRDCRSRQAARCQGYQRQGPCHH